MVPTTDDSDHGTAMAKRHVLENEVARIAPLMSPATFPWRQPGSTRWDSPDGGILEVLAR